MVTPKATSFIYPTYIRISFYNLFPRYVEWPRTFPSKILYYFLVSIIKFTELLLSIHSSNNIGRSYIGGRFREKRKGIRVSVGKSKRKRSLQRRTGREENNIKMDIKKM